MDTGSGPGKSTSTCMMYLIGPQQALSGPTVDLRLGESARNPSALHGPSSRSASVAPIIVSLRITGRRRVESTPGIPDVK